MPQTLAVVLLLNGTQIQMPQPALLIQGTVWVPLRAVCERLGARVAAGNVPGQVIVTAGRARHVFGGAVHRGPEPAVPSMLYNQVTYAPARELASRLHGRCAWSRASQTLALDIPWAGPPVDTSVTQITSDPLVWAGRPVRIAGRHLGCRPCPLFPTVASLPPATDALAIGDPFPVYHTARAAGLGPLTALGRPATLTGTVGLSPAGGTFVRGASLATTNHDCSLRLELDSLSVGHGGALWLELIAEPEPGAKLSAEDLPGILQRARFITPAGREPTRGLRRDNSQQQGADSLVRTERGVAAFLQWQSPADPGRTYAGVWTLRVEVQDEERLEQMFYRTKTETHTSPR